MREELTLEVFERYLEIYIKELTAGKEEAFLAVTGVEPELLREARLPVCEGVAVVVVEKDDYAAAVRSRNDENIRRLVLLSAGAVSQIDSLKDFVEYHIIPEERDLLWRVLDKVFEIQADEKVRDYVNLILLYAPVEIMDLLEYINSSIPIQKSNERVLSYPRLNLRTDIFGIWRTKSTELNRGALRRRIQCSKPDLLHSRLGKALSENRPSEALKKKIEKALDTNNLEDLFKKVTFEEVKDFFSQKRPISSEKKAAEQEGQEERVYQYSYDMLLEEDYAQIAEVEEALKSDCGFNAGIQDGGENAPAGDGGAEPPQVNLWADTPFQEAGVKFLTESARLEQHIKDLEGLIENADASPVIQAKKDRWKQYLTELCAAFKAAVERGDYNKRTPILLEEYCENQKKFISTYFQALAFLMTDQAMQNMCDATDWVEQIQCLFCEKEKGVLRMPFYHPAAGLYFWYLRELYRDAVRGSKELELSADIPVFLLNQEKIWFPIRFLQCGDKLYQLDYSSLQLPGGVCFYECQERISNSLVNFRLLNSAIAEYIQKNPYLSQVILSIVDLDDFKGLGFLLRSLRDMIKNGSCLLDRITINVISLKEQHLKRELAGLSEIGIKEPEIYIKFVREKYLDAELGFDLDKLTGDSDILFFADTSVIYNAGKLVKFTEEPNEAVRRLSSFRLEEQIKLLFQGKNYIEVLWDTLHRIQNGGEAVPSVWSNQNLNIQKLKQLGDKVQSDPHFAAVIISSNSRMMNYVYHDNFYTVKNGRASASGSLILTLSQRNKKEDMTEKGETSAEISLSGLLDDLTGEQDYCAHVLENDTLKGVFLVFHYSEGAFFFGFRVEEHPQEDLTKEVIQSCEKLITELLEYAFAESGFLQNKFRGLLIQTFYEKTDNYRLALALYHLSRFGPGKIALQYDENPGEEKERENICRVGTDIMEFQELLAFFEGIVKVDESCVTRFQEFYKEEMLEKILHVVGREKLLEESMIQNMEKMYERIRK